VASAHREENVDNDSRLRNIADILCEVCETYGFPIIFSAHPRTQKRLQSYDIKLHPLVRTLKPLGFIDYVKLQKNALCVISDSGTITEESSILNFPAINLREVHERPEGMEEGAVIMTGLNKQRVLDSIPIAIGQGHGSMRTLEMVGDYCAPNVSEKVLRIIVSYTDYIKRRVWYMHG